MFAIKCVSLAILLILAFGFIGAGTGIIYIGEKKDRAISIGLTILGLLFIWVAALNFPVERDSELSYRLTVETKDVSRY